MRTIQVTGKGKISVKPDRMRLQITLEGVFKEYGETLRHSSEDTKKISDLISEFGFETEEIFPSMGSDDFSYYKAKAPAYYMTFGIRKGADFPIAHTPIFNFDEAILPIASAQFASCALA